MVDLSFLCWSSQDERANHRLLFILAVAKPLPLLPPRDEGNFSIKLVHGFLSALDHRLLSLQFGELSVFRGVVGQLIVGEDSPWNDVRAHSKSSSGNVSAGYASAKSARR